MVAHDHHHHALHSLQLRRDLNRRKMWVALLINAAMVLVALVGGVATGSIALLAEGGHVLSDVGAIAIGIAAARLAASDPTPTRTFGLQRTEILGALLNGVGLLVISLLVVAGAVARLLDPADVAGGGVLVLGVAGLAGNVAATWVLASGERSDVNLEGVLRHSAADALSSLGVIVAGVIVLATGWDQADALIGILIAAMIAAGSWRLLREPVEVLLESAPAGIDVSGVGRAMVSERDVLEVHDLHVWAVTSGFPALSAHVLVRPGCERDAVREGLERMLERRFDIHHTTLQVVEGTSASGLIELEQLGGGPAPRPD